MKTFTINSIYLIAFLLLSFSSWAQTDSFVHQDFNTDCATTAMYVPHWMIFNPPSTDVPEARWTCAPSGGNSGTPGITCTNTFFSSYHLDTSYLVTPLLDITNDTGRVFFNFDSKTDIFRLGGRLSLLYYQDTFPFRADSPHTDVTLSLLPVIGTPDSSGWVTHHLEITSYKGSVFFLAFRYTAPTTMGNMWHIDNVNTTFTPPGSLTVRTITKTEVPVSVLGNTTGEKIALSLNVPDDGLYDIQVYDIMGRLVYKSATMLKAGIREHTIDNLDMRPGMYYIKVNNGKASGAARFIVQ